MQGPVVAVDDPARVAPGQFDRQGFVIRVEVAYKGAEAGDELHATFHHCNSGPMRPHGPSIWFLYRGSSGLATHYCAPRLKADAESEADVLGALAAGTASPALGLRAEPLTPEMVLRWLSVGAQVRWVELARRLGHPAGPTETRLLFARLRVFLPTLPDPRWFEPAATSGLLEWVGRDSRTVMLIRIGAELPRLYRSPYEMVVLRPPPRWVAERARADPLPFDHHEYVRNQAERVVPGAGLRVWDLLDALGPDRGPSGYPAFLREVCAAILGVPRACDGLPVSPPATWAVDPDRVVELWR